MSPANPRRTRKSNPWWAWVALYAGAVMLVSLMPTGATPRVPHLDKVVHLCEYLLFAWLLVQAIRAGRLLEREYLVMAWMYATSYGLLMELLQALVPWRSADWADALFNALGAAAGIWLAQHWPKSRSWPRTSASRS